MIQRVVLHRFKRFKDLAVELPGHIILAGPNNMGKTTLLQAIAAWDLAFNRWKQLNDFQRHGGSYTKAPIARPTFAAVPVRSFEMLWNDRAYQGSVDVELHLRNGPAVTMEFLKDSTEQIYVRPKNDVEPKTLRDLKVETVFVPPMTGLGISEPVYMRPKVDQLLGQGKPGDVIRNLLLEAHGSETAWAALSESIQRLFGHKIVPPDGTGADIVAEYESGSSGIRLDIASAGSGLQQVLMLLTFLHTRPASVLLLDEPDAHLHVILQDVIYSELRSVAAKQGSQLIIATHSEVIIDSADPMEICLFLNQPRPVADSDEKRRLIESLGILSHVDIIQALDAPGVLYAEDFTDVDILREWARILEHPAYKTLTTGLFWKKTVSETRPGARGIRARDHFDALQLLRPDLPALELVDGDSRSEIQSSDITGRGFQRQRWKRYEIESYLLHPDALARFVEKQVGLEAAGPHVADLRKQIAETFPPAFARDPFVDLTFLLGTKARTDLIPPLLTAAGLPAFPYTRYSEIAAVMKPEEIHPEVREKLDAIQKAFRL